jgi:Tfp pilus tip-associated adhesin PilY1
LLTTPSPPLPSPPLYPGGQQCVPLAEEDTAVLLIVTASGVRAACLPLSSGTTSALSKLSSSSSSSSGLSSMSYSAKDGVNVTCSDARMGDRGEVEVFLGTSSGVTLSVSVPPSGGKAAVRTEMRCIRMHHKTLILQMIASQCKPWIEPHLLVRPLT